MRKPCKDLEDFLRRATFAENKCFKEKDMTSYEDNYDHLFSMIDQHANMEIAKVMIITIMCLIISITF